MLSSFTKKFELDRGFTEFSFTRIFNGWEVVFFVTAIEVGRRSHIFRMSIQQGEWKIRQPQKVASSIVEVESQLAQAIVETDPF